MRTNLNMVPSKCHAERSTGLVRVSGAFNRSTQKHSPDGSDSEGEWPG